MKALEIVCSLVFFASVVWAFVGLVRPKTLFFAVPEKKTPIHAFFFPLTVALTAAIFMTFASEGGWFNCIVGVFIAFMALGYYGKLQDWDKKAPAGAKKQTDPTRDETLINDLEKAYARIAELEPYQAILDAKVEAMAIINKAKTEARAIADEAVAAKNKAEDYEKAAAAFKNIINGYGDEYLVPSQSFLDDLADGYSHQEAGQKLKEARAASVAIIKRGRAAVCGYTEDSRRNTATAFVIDAFNGKVDSILAKIKSDNGGKLKQAIMDAFAQVNFNGKAFRDARITQEFLDARLAELNWGVIASELRDRDREEQRQIRERMREEEKARKEYERSLKAAQAEETRIQAAIDKAREQAAQAGEEQKSKYEAQIQELMGKLAEAESKQERAQSMAQQTRAGHVYIISNVGSFGDDVLKIGMTRRLEPLDRVKELGDASVPFFFDIHAMIYSNDAPALEAELHRRFNLARLNKVNFRKEFFRVDLAEVRKAVEELSLDAQFTMAAEAREYRETLAIEKMPEAERLAKLNILMRQEESTPVEQRADESESEAA